jgi:hypothetical protein
MDRWAYIKVCGLNDSLLRLKSDIYLVSKRTSFKLESTSFTQIYPSLNLSGTDLKR